MTTRFDLPLTPEERVGLARRASGLTCRPALAAVCLGELPAFVRQDCAACGLYLEQYALPLSMLGGMFLAIPITNLVDSLV